MLYFIVILICYPVLRAIQVGKRNRAKKPRRFLIYQTAKTGDLVCTTHVFRGVKKKYPDAHLAVVASKNTAPILRSNPRVDDIIVVNSGLRGLSSKIHLARRLLGGSYDVAIVLIPNPALVFVSIFALIPDVLTIVPDVTGFTQRAVSLFCKRVKHRTGTLTMASYLKVLELVGIDNGDLTKEVYFTTDDEDKAKRFILEDEAVSNKTPLIGLVVSSGNKMKSLEFADITYLTQRLVQGLNARVLLLGAGSDRPVSRRIGQALQFSSIIDSCGEFSLSELPALISMLDLVIGVDTGPIYIADSLDIPLIVIAGPCDMGDQRPIGRNVRIIDSNCDCAPCSHTFRSPYECRRADRFCLTQLDKDKVLFAAAELLGK